MNFRTDISPGKGKILISAPALSDVFKKSVICLCEHDKNGSIGFIFSSPTKYKINEILEDFPEFDSYIMLGGPVQPELINVIHRAPLLIDGGYEISKGIFWGGNFESIKEAIYEGKLSPVDVRFFLGYSGWSPNQLNEEIERDSWLVSNLNEQDLFETDRNLLWDKSIRALGQEFAFLRAVPDDPSMN